VTHRSLGAFALSLLLSAPAAAASTSFTPPVSADMAESAGCLVQNLDTRPRTVTATLRGQDGASLDTATVEVAPGAVSTLAATTGQFGVYCEFQGLRRRVRGFVNVNDGATTLLVLPAGK
jgi:hypothetical protein